MKVRITTGTFVEFRMRVKLTHSNAAAGFKIVKIESMKELSAEVRKFNAVKVETLGHECIFKEDN
jgi:hypothetical protein